jgi:rare lipoprotein A
MPKKFGAGVLACFLFPAAVLSRDTGPLQHKDQAGKPGKPVKTPGKPGKGSHKTTKTSRKPVTVQYGIASFYANKFEGRKTYTDEIFSQKKLTAASNTLPMHTWVRVTNLRNHLSVVLRINDKMHPKNKRLIDLSHAAAVRLGYAGRGLTRVKVEVYGRKKPAEASEELASKEQ